MTSKKADILAVAKAARVSASTVSRSFNHPELVKPNTRKKIDAAVRRLGYIRNRAAQTIHGIRSGTIGLIVPTIDHAIFAEVVQAFSDALDDDGFTILLATHGYDLNREYARIRKLMEHRVDGLVLIGVKHSQETFDLIESQDVPTVLMWNYAAESSLPCIGANNEEAGRLIAQHLIDMGHQDVALLVPPMAENDRATDRISGIRNVLAQAGVNLPASRLIESPYSILAAKEAVSALCSGDDRPTALLCGNDVLAWGALYAARSLGISVPEELSIAGIGDFRGSQEFEPPLTTVRMPARQIGQRAAEAISRMVRDDDAEVENFDCGVELQVRGTSAPPKPSIE